MPHCALRRSEDNLWTFVLSFYHEDFEEEIWSIRLCNKVPYQWRHLTGSLSCILTYPNPALGQAGRKLRHILAYKGYVFHSEAVQTPQDKLQAHGIEISGEWSSNSGTQSGMNTCSSLRIGVFVTWATSGLRSDVSSTLLMSSPSCDELMLLLEDDWESEPDPTSAPLTPHRHQQAAPEIEERRVHSRAQSTPYSETQFLT